MEDVKPKAKKADYWDDLAAAMRDRDIVNPREIDDQIVEAIRTRHGK